MSRLLSIHEAAEAEINEAYDYKSPQLGSVFIDEIQRTIERLAKFPDAAPLIRGRVRKKALLIFPYSIVYSVDLTK